MAKAISDAAAWAVDKNVGEPYYNYIARAALAALSTPTDGKERIAVLEEALRAIRDGAALGLQQFTEAMSRLARPAWRQINILHDNLAACQGSAEAALADQPKEGE